MLDSVLLALFVVSVAYILYLERSLRQVEQQARWRNIDTAVSCVWLPRPRLDASLLGLHRVVTWLSGSPHPLSMTQKLSL
jgi:hypothetical protein